MPRKTIYVRDADQDLWAQAEKLAGDDESLAGVVAAALRDYIAAKKAWGSPVKRLSMMTPETSSASLAYDVRKRQQTSFQQMLADHERRLHQPKRQARKK